MDTEHAPTLWISHGDFIGTDEEDSQTIAYCSDHRNRRPRSHEETLALAESIVRACNSYPDLLAACVDVIKRVKGSDAWWMDEPGRGGIDIEMLEAAIAKATAKS